MAIKDLVKMNGTETKLPVRREEEYPWPTHFNEMSQWMHQWNRWFESVFGRTFGLTPFREFEQRWPYARYTFVPAMNVADNEKEFRVTAELPGMDEKDIEVSINKHVLAIKGHKKEEAEEKGTDYYRMERSYGEFHRSIPLPEEVDENKIAATFKKGVLTITLPKRPELQTGVKKIAVKTET